MIIGFDLDDTLYNEKDFYLFCLKSVSKYLEINFFYHKRKSHDIFKELINIDNEFGRENILNIFLEKHLNYNKKNLKTLIDVYRHTKPKIKLNADFKKFLKNDTHKKFLITDGHKIVQKNKIESLKLEKYFDKIIITNQYGLKYQKPNPYCFQIIKSYFNCQWKDLIYIGDNPNKDFIFLNQKGGKTIRLLNGRFKDLKLNKPKEANLIYNNSSDITKYLCKLNKN